MDLKKYDLEMNTDDRQIDRLEELERLEKLKEKKHGNY